MTQSQRRDLGVALAALPLGSTRPTVAHAPAEAMAGAATPGCTRRPVPPPVHVRVTGTEELVRLEVAHEGPGMPAEVVARAFERFYRADTSRGRATGGSGLGLSIVQAVVEAHGGTATAASTLGGGSHFTVELPAAP